MEYLLLLDGRDENLKELFQCRNDEVLSAHEIDDHLFHSVEAVVRLHEPFLCLFSDPVEVTLLEFL